MPMFNFLLPSQTSTSDNSIAKPTGIYEISVGVLILLAVGSWRRNMPKHKKEAAKESNPMVYDRVMQCEKSLNASLAFNAPFFLVKRETGRHLWGQADVRE